MFPISSFYFFVFDRVFFSSVVRNNGALYKILNTNVMYRIIYNTFRFFVFCDINGIKIFFVLYFFHRLVQ